MIKKILVTWIILGFINVYLAGIIDKKMNSPNSAPTTFLFLIGPAGTAICGIIYLIYLDSEYGPFNFIYQLGLKQGE